MLADEHAVERAHVCHAGCDHYHFNGRWYVVASHRHGPGCGHMLRGGLWVVIR